MRIPNKLDRIDFNKPLTIYPAYTYKPLSYIKPTSIHIPANHNHINLFDHVLLGDILSNNLQLFWTDKYNTNMISTFIELVKDKQNDYHTIGNKSTLSLLLSQVTPFMPLTIDTNDLVESWYAKGDFDTVYIDFFEKEALGITSIYVLSEKIIPNNQEQYQQQRNLLTGILFSVYNHDYIYDADLTSFRLIKLLKKIQTANFIEGLIHHNNFMTSIYITRYMQLTNREKLIVKSLLIDNIKSFIDSLEYDFQN